MASIIKIGDKWRAQIRRAGQKSISKTFTSKAAAERWARGIEGSIEDGTHQALTALRLADVIERYRELRDASPRPISDTSNEHYQLKRLAELLGDKVVEKLDVSDILEFAKTRANDGAGPYTINMDVSKLGTVLRHMAAVLKFRPYDVVGASRPVLKHLQLIGSGGKRDRRPTADELMALFAWFAKQPSYLAPYMEPIIKVAVTLGLRRGELFRIRWADLNVEKRMLLVRDRKDPRKKKGNDQYVPLIGDTLEIMMALPRTPDQELIFPCHPQTVSKLFTTACRELAIPDLHFHDMKHEAVSSLLEAGWTEHEARLVSGHRGKSFDIYANLSPAHALTKEPPKRKV